MYVAPVDIPWLNEDTAKLVRQYRAKFGVAAPMFNYADFQRDGEKCAGQVFREWLEKALEGDEPPEFVSKYQDFYDELIE